MTRGLVCRHFIWTFTFHLTPTKEDQGTECPAVLETSVAYNAEFPCSHIILRVTQTMPTSTPVVYVWSITKRVGAGVHARTVLALFAPLYLKKKRKKEKRKPFAHLDVSRRAFSIRIGTHTHTHTHVYENVVFVLIFPIARRRITIIHSPARRNYILYGRACTIYNNITYL